MLAHKSEHLKREEQIQMGSYYTPEELVDLVYKYIEPYAKKHPDDLVYFDNAAGCGAFLLGMEERNCRAADLDAKACDFLRKHLNSKHVYLSNSLSEISRSKFAIPEDAFLIMLGNPPYNDTTSAYKNGHKGKNICDEDIYDRDTGISFLKSYAKLKANLVCVLHPLSYLIKESNFKRLREFRENYKLVKGTIFPSSMFHMTGSTKFPIVIALYERNDKGMDFEYIRNFPFDILNSRKRFLLRDHKTTDGYIAKYPPRKDDIKESPLGIYYYTFRDFNSLKRNASFMLKKHSNSIVVTLDNFYKYAYLYSLKSLFNPNDAWLYGNLSPLADMQRIEQDKKLYVSYAIKTNRIFNKAKRSVLNKITRFYDIEADYINNPAHIERIIKNRLDRQLIP